MENKSCTKICRFCLEKSDSYFETIEEVTYANLDFLWLKLNLSISEVPVMCGDCATTIRNYSDFKTKCLDIENCIVSSVKYKDSIRIDLREVYMRKMPVENIVNVREEYMVCRLCLELVKNYSAVFLRNSTDIVLKLEQYFPELDLACTEDPVICSSCQVSLQQYFSFANTCLTSEDKITEYCKLEGTNIMGHIDLNSVIRFISKYVLKCKLEVDTLKIEETDNEDSENAINDVEIKKEEILHMELDIKEESPQQESILTDENSSQCHPSPSQSDCVLQTACSYQGKCKRQPQLHMVTHQDDTEVTLYKCDLCAYETRYKSCLQRHMLVHKHKSEIEMHKCKLCSYETKWRFSLRKHVLAHRNTPLAVVKSGIRYKCDLCDFETKCRKSLKRHMMVTHEPLSEISKFSCYHCGFETIYKENLKKHMTMHMDVSKIKMYKCDLCDFETKWKKSLKVHMLTHQTHSEITMYKCNHCEYKSKLKGALKRHMLTHQDPSEITMFECDHCDYETKHKDNLQKHIRKHKR